MPEYLKRDYLEEKEFLDEFDAVAAAAVQLLGGAWTPGFECDDRARKQRRYFLVSGEQSRLVFDGAAVYHDRGGFSSAVVVLRSSKRMVSIRVCRDGESLSAEMVLDRTPQDGGQVS